jgi:phosphoribosylformylglycinamidine (FGAM) synthase-like enzyme
LIPITELSWPWQKRPENLSCVGADPIAVTDNLNFGSPENSIGYWQLATACQGIAEACREMNTPVTGGNVSLYNETVDAVWQPQSIYPTPVIGMVGLVPNMGKFPPRLAKSGGFNLYFGFFFANYRRIRIFSRYSRFGDGKTTGN